LKHSFPVWRKTEQNEAKLIKTKITTKSFIVKKISDITENEGG